MIKQKQLYRHKPAEGMIGDCWRTCLACLLDLTPASVPHFVALAGVENSEGSRKLSLEWLATKGLTMVEVPYNAALEDIQRMQGGLNPGVHYLLSGNSRTGVGHSVIGCGDSIAWDPSLDDAGIVGPMDDGHYWITWLVPLQLQAIEQRPPVPAQCGCLVMGPDYCEVHAA